MLLQIQLQRVYSMRLIVAKTCAAVRVVSGTDFACRRMDQNCFKPIFETGEKQINDLRRLALVPLRAYKYGGI